MRNFAHLFLSNVCESSMRSALEGNFHFKNLSWYKDCVYFQDCSNMFWNFFVFPDSAMSLSHTWEWMLTCFSISCVGCLAGAGVWSSGVGTGSVDMAAMTTSRAFIDICRLKENNNISGRKSFLLRSRIEALFEKPLPTSVQPKRSFQDALFFWILSTAREDIRAKISAYTLVKLSMCKTGLKTSTF